MTRGFRATDEDDEPTPDMRDGVASERELSPAEHIDLFVSLCERMRAMGAIEVRANEYRAVWPQQSQPARPSVVTVPLGGKEREPTAPPKPLERYEGEKLSPADRERRQFYDSVREGLIGD